MLMEYSGGACVSHFGSAEERQRGIAASACHRYVQVYSVKMRLTEDRDRPDRRDPGRAHSLRGGYATSYFGQRDL